MNMFNQESKCETISLLTPNTSVYYGIVSDLSKSMSPSPQTNPSPEIPSNSLDSLNLRLTMISSISLLHTLFLLFSFLPATIPAMIKCVSLRLGEENASSNCLVNSTESSSSFSIALNWFLRS